MPQENTQPKTKEELASKLEQVDASIALEQENIEKAKITLIETSFKQGLSKEEIMQLGFTEAEVDAHNPEKKEQGLKLYNQLLAELKTIQRERVQLQKEYGELGENTIKEEIKPADTLTTKSIEEKNKLIEDIAFEEVQKDEVVNAPLTVEAKNNMEELTSAQIKTEIEKIIKGDFASKLEENGIKYADLDISSTNNGFTFHIVANFKGGFVKGNPKFIADISSGINDSGNKTLVTNYKLEANAIVSAFAPKDKMHELAANLEENLKKHLEKEKKRKIDRLEISGGVLKIFYK